MAEHSNLNKLKEIEQYKVKSEILEKELNKTKEELNAILNSNSWRITKPIRELKKFLKSIFNI
jgi:hypothetical protein